MMNTGRHLDLGCGKFPRNPFFASELYGIDIIEPGDSLQGFNYRKCNLSTEKIPFHDNFFDSISGYDFIEHIPRVHIEGGHTRFPFVELMSEIYRVLKPGGVFYALTPCFPKESAFVDPTHVNFISRNTHKYFTAPYCWAKMYGFNGAFSKLDVRIVNFEMEEKKFIFYKRMILQLLNLLFPRREQHILWKFTAIK
ncbi:MAG: class I SAM-dependent methyltransferase [Sphingomonadales bacterium]|jgi:SAM-dependent methyltransferase